MKKFFLYITFLYLLILASCSKQYTEYTAFDLLIQGGWKIIGVKTITNQTIFYNTSYPEIFIRFNKNGTINGNYDGNFNMMYDSMMTFKMKLDTNYAPYPDNFYIVYQAARYEQKAVLQFHSFKELKILGEKYIFELELY